MADVDDLPGANSAELGNAAFVLGEFERTRREFLGRIVTGQDVPGGPIFISVGGRPDLFLGTQPFVVYVALTQLFPTGQIPFTTTAKQVADALGVLVPILRAFPGNVGDVPGYQLRVWILRALRELQARRLRRAA